MAGRHMDTGHRSSLKDAVLADTSYSALELRIAAAWGTDWTRWAETKKKVRENRRLAKTAGYAHMYSARGTITGRFSSGLPQPQNFPVRRSARVDISPAAPEVGVWHLFQRPCTEGVTDKTFLVKITKHTKGKAGKGKTLYYHYRTVKGVVGCFSARYWHKGMSRPADPLELMGSLL